MHAIYSMYVYIYYILYVYVYIFAPDIHPVNVNSAVSQFIFHKF